MKQYQLTFASIQKEVPTFDPRSCTVYSGGVELPSQIDDTDRNGSPDLLTFVTDFAPNEQKIIVLRWGPHALPKKEYRKRTQADMSIKVDYEFVNGKYAKGRFVRIDSVRVPAVHVDHDGLFQHEGPAWESDKIGYRFYLDARNRTDIFGKKVADMVLNTAGVHDLVANNNESYESMLNWGMDNFKVGTSLGIGSIAMQSGTDVVTVSNTDSVFCVIAANGPVRSDVRAVYYGWNVAGKKYDLISSYSITAGSRLTMCKERFRQIRRTSAPVSQNMRTQPSSSRPVGRTKVGSILDCLGSNPVRVTTWELRCSIKDRRKSNDAATTSVNLSSCVRAGVHWNTILLRHGSRNRTELRRLEEFRSYLESIVEKLNNPIRVIF